MWKPPTLMVVKRSSAGGDAPPTCRPDPSSLLPQHTGVPSGRNAQVCPEPLLMVVNTSPSGGTARPFQSCPQQTGVPSSRKETPTRRDCIQPPSGGSGMSRGDDHLESGATQPRRPS